ncbi:hypothetical protein [Runella sp.]|uniref:hypothetical protein n=1 Tax=Runella sp. TaxID=1960881 RepID=UPI003D13D93E
MNKTFFFVFSVIILIVFFASKQKKEVVQTTPNNKEPEMEPVVNPLKGAKGETGAAGPQGVQGPAGTPAPKFYYGTTNPGPDQSIYSQGDFWINTTTGTLWEKLSNTGIPFDPDREYEIHDNSNWWKVSTLKGDSAGKGYSLAEMKAVPNSVLTNYQAVYLKDDLKEGNYKLDAADTTTPGDDVLTVVTNNGQRLKRVIDTYLYPEVFGPKGDGVNEDGVGFQNYLVAFAKYYAKLDQVSANYSAELGFPVIDLRGRCYKISQELTLPTIGGRKAGQFTIRNGTFYIGDGLAATADKYLFRLADCENVDFESLMIYGKANSIANRNAFYVADTSISVKFNKVRASEISQFIKTELHTYDVTIDGCYVRNYVDATPSPNFIDIQGDAFINNTYLINVVTPIVTRGGNNLIRGNHLYGVKGPVGIDVLETSVGDIISHNYFDGCAVRADRFGTGLILNDNYFQNLSTYSAIILRKTTGAYQPANLSIQDNHVHFYQERTPEVANVNFSYDSGTGIITVISGLVLTDIHVGGMLQVDPDRRLQIWDYISATQARVKQMGRYYVPTAASYTTRLVPMDVLIQNGDDLQTMSDRPNVFIQNNILTINNTIGGFVEHPVVINEQSGWYTRITKKLIGAMRFFSINPFSIISDVSDYDMLKITKSDGTLLGKIGYAIAGVIRIGTTNKGFVFTDGRFSPETTDDLNLGESYARWKNAFVKTVQADKLNINTAGAAPAAGIVALAGGTATVNTTAVTANSIVMITSQSGAKVASYRVSARTAGASFVISSSDNTDDNVVGWQFVN